MRDIDGCADFVVGRIESMSRVSRREAVLPPCSNGPMSGEESAGSNGSPDIIKLKVERKKKAPSFFEKLMQRAQEQSDKQRKNKN